MSTFFVLGATGTVGAALTERLTQAGHTVRAATRSPDAYAGPGTPVGIDLAAPTDLERHLEGVDGVFLLSPPGWTDQYAALRPVLEAVATSNVRRVVTMTAQGIDSDDSIPFRRLELAVEASGKTFVHLRPTWFSDNFHTFWGHGVRTAHTLALPAGDASVAFIDSRDIAAAAFAALTRNDIELDRAYELTGPEAITHGAAAAVLSQAIGAPITYTSIDDDAFRTQLAPSGLPADYIEFLVGLFALVRMGVASRVTGDVETLTGHPPRSVAVYASDQQQHLRS